MSDPTPEAIEARQSDNGCLFDGCPDVNRGVACCVSCVCEREARLGYVLCDACCQNPADLPSNLCPGCEAYREHQA